MSRQDRCDGYANPQAGPHGASRDEKNLDYWAKCATKNSYNGGGNTGAADTGPRAKAKADKNVTGNTFMRGVRRES
ncbi:hypothetical protein [Bradyrhizobium sp. AUGA SZCCT0042]|uniref:hypothetical protein n=1 Tax=Bradyrhizobium sp. AUGA SZCCT0042 TaxID=2807651 RepID=UPI001BADD091|nr:hypothetical protein [Bradyrhizobium sp. AUGA SZCCT0042]MBR1298547.1 hypothetical protein [Bradyrhizobium sp. AUGA SZCCT0042]